ncbi:hypothetical protein [Paenibacillus polymyxa]|uniref:hypothetical protein n=1 Tax=Paenibacillus polymyxa TaxID=1406 RepID=UPI000CD9FF0F|nr:hypothetical protein [Paenibacillus polymyxa]POR29282.1 hypothetical protein CG775_06925 [Paenibacillus polymyxa]
MSNLSDFLQKKRQTQQSANADHHYGTEVQKDIQALQESLRKSDGLGVSSQQALQIAADFYRKYPALIEYVRSNEYLFRHRKVQLSKEAKPIKKLVPTVQRQITSKEGLDPQASSDYDFHKDVLE